ncbi:MAG: DUF1844 domain-containing protein [Armatimonadetes bacterium]|nr:DUF1844 domain-containing protein [Armatimonadota bacterium]
MSEEEKGYEVIDKRRVRADAPDSDGPAPEPPDESPEIETFAEASCDETVESEGPSEETPPAMPPIDVYTLLMSFIGMLGAQAWQWMGLVTDPSTGKIEKDLVQAKVAIDSIAALATQLDGKISDADSKELQSMLSDLRINFVRQS